MRRKINGYGRDLNYIYADAVNVTNVTNNVTQVSHVSGCSPRKFGKRKRRHGGKGKNDRNPKLLRYCASGGLLDQDVAYGMSDKELCDGFVNVGAYAVRGFASTADAWTRDVGRGMRKIGSSIMGLLECYLS